MEKYQYKEKPDEYCLFRSLHHSGVQAGHPCTRHLYIVKGLKKIIRCNGREHKITKSNIDSEVLFRHP